MFDEDIFHTLRLLSGHALKHVAAAADVYFTVLSLARRDSQGNRMDPTNGEGSRPIIR